MADYVTIDNLANKGKIQISYLAFEKLVNDAILNVPGIAKSSKHLNKNQKFRLNRPVKITIRNSVINIKVIIEVAEGINKDEVIETLENEIHQVINTITEQTPVEIKIETVNVK